MSSFLSFEHWDEDVTIENYIREYDKTVMPVPDIEFEPYIILNKVRKYYMEYIIKLLSVNYERNVRIPNQKLYRLPSAIWRCAKDIEISAAQTSMVLQIYRSNMLSVVEELKNDTKAGILNRKLYDCLHKRPENEKRTQTSLTNLDDCKCQCSCNLKKKMRKSSDSPNIDSSMEYSKSEKQKNMSKNECLTSQLLQLPAEQLMQSQIAKDVDNKKSLFPAKATEGVAETQTSDELVRQLEKLFEGDGNDDDIFESVLCDDLQEENLVNYNSMQVVSEKQDSVVEAHSAQIKSLDERLVSLAGLIINTDKNTPEKSEAPIHKTKKITTSKWLCEEYFLKMKLLELLDQINDYNRSRLKEIKVLFVDLFGDESEDENLLSPLNETPEFILSCKERIAPWVVKMLTPYYIKGRIKGKAIFKALAKHLIRLIYQCSPYPEQYEVHSFVSDFLKTHKVIRCEADFKEFKIKNI